MSERANYISEKNILILTSKGIITKEIMDEDLESINHFYNSENCTKIMMDIRKVEKAPNVFEIFQFMNSFPKTTKCAMLYDENKSYSKELNFTETTALNSLIHFKTFTNETKAMNWLTK